MPISPTQNIQRMSKILVVDWSVKFAMDDDRDKSRMKEAANELASVISSLNCGSEEMHIQNNLCNWQDRKC